MKWKPALLRAFRLIVSLGLLLYLFMTVDLQMLWLSVQTAKLGCVVGAILLIWFGWTVMALRWQQLLKAVGWELPFGGVWAITQSSLFFGYFSPGQVGSEVVRWIRLSNDTKGKSIATAVSLLFDRLLGLTLLAIIGGITMFGYQGILITPVIRIVFAVLMSGSILFWLLLLAQANRASASTINRLTQPITCYLRSTSKLLAQILEVVDALQGKTGYLIMAACWGIVFHSVNIVVNWLIACALGLQIPLLQLTIIYSIVSILTALPVSIAGIGVREISYIALLNDIGYTGGAANALPVVIFAATLLSVVLLGGSVELSDSLRRLFFPPAAE